MNSFDAQCLSTAVLVTKVVLDDVNWRGFGYSRRPRRGRIFHGLVGASALARETTLLRELWGAGYATVVCWALDKRPFTHRVAFIARLLEYSIDGVQTPIWPSLRFDNRRDAIAFLDRASRDYMSEQPKRRTLVFHSRCTAAMAGQTPKEWLAGTAVLFAHPGSLVFRIPWAMDQSGVSENNECDVQDYASVFWAMAETLVRDHDGLPR